MGVERKRGGRTATWPQASVSGGRYRSGWAETIRAFGQNWIGYLKHWVTRDTLPGRLFPWLPVAFGVGITLYFAAIREPAWWSGLLLLAPAVAACVGLRARSI